MKNLFLCAIYTILFPIFIYANPLDCSKQIGMIIIDPAHGGIDPGATASHMIVDQQIILLEKEITLYVAENLRRQLIDLFPDVNVIMTRERDVFMSLEERMKIANSVNLGEDKISVFISIHVNYSFNKNNSGYEIWVKNDLTQNSEDLIIAEKLSNEFANIFGETLSLRGIKPNDFFLLRNVNIPALIIELGFLSNNDDVILLSSDDGIYKYASALSRGIETYIEALE